MPTLTRQQLCAELGVSESTIRRSEQRGMPVLQLGRKTKRYDLADCMRWLKENCPPSGGMHKAGSTSRSLSKANEFTAAARKVRLRVKPS